METRVDLDTSKNTMVNWYNFYRDICTKTLESQDVQKIGSMEKIVEIDKSKFRERKFHKDARKEGQPVFGGVKRGNINHMFLVYVPNKTKETLMNMIFEHIERSTTIINDCWKEYNTKQLTNAGFTHLTINHFNIFYNLDIGAYINSIIGTWLHVKWSLNKNNTIRNCYQFIL